MQQHPYKHQFCWNGPYPWRCVLLWLYTCCLNITIVEQNACTTTLKHFKWKFYDFFFLLTWKTSMTQVGLFFFFYNNNTSFTSKGWKRLERGLLSLPCGKNWQNKFSHFNAFIAVFVINDKGTDETNRITSIHIYIFTHIILMIDFFCPNPSELNVIHYFKKVYFLIKYIECIISCSLCLCKTLLQLGGRESTRSRVFLFLRNLDFIIYCMQPFVFSSVYSISLCSSQLPQKTVPRPLQFVKYSK